MIIHAQQIFDKILLDRDPSEFIDYVSDGVERELVTKVMDKLKDHKLYIVKLHEPGIIENLPGSWTQQCAYRQDLQCMEVIQCKNCRMVYPWCQKFRDELGGDGFCPYGKPVALNINITDTPQKNCDRYVVTNDEDDKEYNCIGCGQTDCPWK